MCDVWYLQRRLKERRQGVKEDMVDSAVSWLAVSRGVETERHALSSYNSHALMSMHPMPCHCCKSPSISHSLHRGRGSRQAAGAEVAWTDLAFWCAFESGTALNPVGQVSKTQPGLELGGEDCHTKGLVSRWHLHFLDVCMTLRLFRAGRFIQLQCFEVLAAWWQSTATAYCLCTAC